MAVSSFISSINFIQMCQLGEGPAQVGHVLLAAGGASGGKAGGKARVNPRTRHDTDKLDWLIGKWVKAI